MKIALRIAFLLFVVVPVAAWFIVKPVRVIAPAAFGMQCANNSICVETPEKLPEATTLYREALSLGWTPKAFHDRFLQENEMPISAVRALILGLPLSDGELKQWRFLDSDQAYSR